METPEVSEKFSFKKFFGSFFQAVPWAKDARTIIAIFLIAALGYTFWRAYWMPRTKQTQNTQIHVDTGGTLNLSQSQKVEDKKRPWFIPSIFGEFYTFVESDSRKGVGCKGGLRWEL